jgi:hypothetical protein
MPLSKDPAARANQLANIKAHEFEKGHTPTPGGGRPKKVTDMLHALFDQRCTHRRILERLFPDDTPAKRAKRTNGEVLVAAAMQRATIKSDLLTREIFDRIEGKVGPAEPERHIVHIVTEDLLADSDGV